MTARTVIGTALQQLGAVPFGGQPTVDQLDQGLAALRDMFLTWATNGAFGKLGSSCALLDPDNLPTDAPDLTLVRDTETPATYLYDKNTATWTQIDTLAIDDLAPLEARGPSGLSACLAMEIADRIPAQVSPDTQRQAAMFKAAVSLKMGFCRPPVQHEYC